VPDFVTETFTPGTDYGGEDGDGRAARYFGWTYDPDPNDTTYESDYVFLRREGNQPVRVVHDRHTDGLFPRAIWLRLLQDAGFEPHHVTLDFQGEHGGKHGGFVGLRD